MSVSEFTEFSELTSVPSVFGTLTTPSPTSSAPTPLDTNESKFRVQYSGVWAHCVDRPDGQRLYRGERGTIRELWRCRYCYEKNVCREYLRSGGTNIIFDHLEKKHQIYARENDNTGSKNFKRARVDEDIRESLARTADRDNKRRKVTMEEHVLKPETLRDLYAQLVIKESLPLDFVETQAFRSFLQYISPAANDLLPVSAATIKADIQQTYGEKKLEVQHALQTSISSIHFSCDAWTSPANLGILGIVAHFVSEDGGLQKLVLGMKELEGTHSGVNMAKELWAVVEDFGITANLGYFVGDSHPSNDTMLRELSKLLSLHGVTDTWDPILHRLRCNGHIVNLAVMVSLILNLRHSICPLIFPNLRHFSLGKFRI
jgi:hypothetical protein